MGNMSVEGKYRGRLVARDTNAGNAANGTAVVKEWEFTVQQRDTSVPARGPNGKDCAHGERLDGTEFDGSFTCNCEQTRYTGANCEIEVAIQAAAAAAEQGNPWLASGVAAGVLALILLGTALFYRHRVRKARLAAFDFKAHLGRLKETGELYEHDVGVPRELKRKSVTMVTKVGAGAFGEVWKAVLDESDRGGVPGYMVAAKTAKSTDGEAADDLRKEAAVMAQLEQHPNIVSLVGVVTSGTPLLVLLTYCEHGSLLSYLKEHGPPLGTTKKLEMCAGTATGMAYLAEHGFVHRDLAARNVLLDATMTCKIAAFGLSRRTAVSEEAGEFAGGPSSAERAYYRSEKGQCCPGYDGVEPLPSKWLGSWGSVTARGWVCLWLCIVGPRIRVWGVGRAKRTCAQNDFIKLKCCWCISFL